MSVVNFSPSEGTYRKDAPNLVVSDETSSTRAQARRKTITVLATTAITIALGYYVYISVVKI